MYVQCRRISLFKNSGNESVANFKNDLAKFNIFVENFLIPIWSHLDDVPVLVQFPHFRISKKTRELQILKMTYS